MPANSSSPTVLLDALAAAEVPARPLSAAESISLLQALATVPDPRKRRGRRHSLQSILLLTLGAIVAGARSYAAIADWAVAGEHEVRVCADPPHTRTFRRLLCRLDPAALQAALTGWVLGRRTAALAQAYPAGGPAAERRVVLAADGKTLRGTRTPAGAQAKVFGIYDHASGLVLTQTSVADGDEIAAFTTALATLPDLHDVVVTADALHCQREHAAWLHAHGGHYLFTVKANQPTLATALRRLPWATAPGARRRGRGHGRVESRSIKVIDLDGTDLPMLFPAARRGIKVVRRRSTADGRRSTEIVYALTSLDHRAADPRLLAAWLRGHWGIENRVHHVRDVTQREDVSRIRIGNGPQVMAALRNAATNIARLTGHANIAAAQRAAAWHPAAITDALNAA